jgi:hypothetical protein
MQQKNSEQDYYIVAGDSWACGEWTKQGNTHQGLARYLADDGQNTLCFGYPGFGSLTVLDFVRNFIRHNSGFMCFKQMFFFQSDWLRDIRSYRWLNDAHMEVLSKGYAYARDWYVSHLYYGLSALYKESGVATVVIGGQGDTIYLDRFGEEYPGVSIGCQSLTNFAINDCTSIDAPVHSVFKSGGTATMFLSDSQMQTLLTILKNHSNQTELQKLLFDMELAEQRNAIFKSNAHLFPDCLHPDRSVHQKLYQYLCINRFIEF